MRGARPGRAAWLCAAALSATASAALAQPAPPEPPAPTSAAGATAFPAAFFAPYNPVTAADMVSRVPGFELRDGDDRRGFGGSAGNLLINGERPSSKTVPSELLKRIPASSVLRIELISGTSAEVDVRGQSQFVNVVVNAQTRQASPTTYVAGLRYIQYSDRIGYILQASRTIPLSSTAEVAIDLQAPNLLGRTEIHETLISGAGALTGTRFQTNRPDNYGLQGSANLRWRPSDQDAVNVNFQAAPNWNDLDVTQLEAAPSTMLRNALQGHTEFTDNYTVELGGDWEHRFTARLSAKLIVLLSNASVDQFDTFDVFTGPATFLTRTQDRSTDSGERIARAQVKWTASDAHTVEFGGEGAFNFRDTALDIVNTPRGGQPTPVPLAVADARVEELRGELFASDIWTVSPRLTVETGLNVEFSRISQTGDQVQEREFRYVKPRITATYVVDPRNTVRASLIRDVAQLDFAEFSSSVDFVNTSTILGNPDLVPEKAWKARIEWESRFAARTAVTLAAFADQVDDVKDLVDIGGFDAFGNIGDGSRIGMEIRATVPLAPVGLANAELRINGLYQRTRVTDPITGEKRSFSVPAERQGTPPGSPTLNAGNKDWAYVVNFRQNLPKISSSWGAALVQWSGREEYRRAEIFEYQRDEPRFDLFFETTRWPGLTARVFVNNLLSSSEDRTRTFFVTDRSTGVVQRLELRLTDGGPEGSRVFGAQVSGRF